MEQTVLLPSPNWYQATVMGVSDDGWVAYGAPAKGLCILEPVPACDDLPPQKEQNYKNHFIKSAHSEKIVSVDLSPEWATKQALVTGGSDGYVKEWKLEVVEESLQVKAVSAHAVHNQDKEEVVGVGYSSEKNAISVGSFGNIVKWDLHSNVTRKYAQFLKNFKPLCMSCSPHDDLTLAVGTKQGIIFVINVNGNGHLMYKVRGHDDEVLAMVWCPQYEVSVRKTLKDSASLRMERIRNEVNPEDLVTEIEENIAKCTIDAKHDSAIADVSSLSHQSFTEESQVVEEEDLFDMYKDHEHNEFGHKKYQPEEIRVKVKATPKENPDFLAECLKLKKDIYQLQTDPEPSIEALVDTFEKTKLADEKSAESVTSTKDVEESKQVVGMEEKKVQSSSSFHVHRHLLATAGKHGKICVWSKSGKLVSHCIVFNNINKSKTIKSVWSGTLFWYKSNTLLLADGKSNLLECNPLEIDCKNKLEWKIIHSIHKRGLFCIASAAPKKQLPGCEFEDFPIWTSSQDRSMVQYSLKKKEPLHVFATSGGYIYMIVPCPYDAQKVAVSVGDGAVRVWNVDGDTTTYWQNVQGKVLAVAWHQTRENRLAFATAEGRVGLIDTSGKTEKPAKVLRPALSKGVYGLCWGERNQLYACGGKELIVYQADKLDAAPETVPVQLEGKKWGVSDVLWTERALCVGGQDGEVGVLTPHAPHHVVAAAFPFKKTVHCVAWHPQCVSQNGDESPCKNWIACSSTEKFFIILELVEKDDGSIKLEVMTTLSGHSGSVVRLTWSPYRDAHILSTSQDGTVRVWDVKMAVCLSVFTSHMHAVLHAVWYPQPEHPDCIISGGGDYCLRVWNYNNFPAEAATVTKTKGKAKQPVLAKCEEESLVKERTKTKAAKKTEDLVNDEQMAVDDKHKVRSGKKYLFPISYKQQNSGSINVCRLLLKKHLAKDKKEALESATHMPINVNDGKDDAGDTVEGAKDINVRYIADSAETIVNGDEETEVSEKTAADYDTDFVKLFGSIDELNQLLDLEQNQHLKLKNYEAWIVIGIMRGEMDKVLQFASSHDILSPFLISIAPSVSHRFWKDSTQSYLAQMDRLTANLADEPVFDKLSYGGHTLRKMVTLLSMHNVTGAVEVLLEARLMREAYVLARVRHMDSIATQVLNTWASVANVGRNIPTAAVCYIALGNLVDAATILSKSNRQDYLILASEVAKSTGQETLAESIENIIRAENEHLKTGEEILADLPQRLELHLRAKLAEQVKENGCAEEDNLSPA